MRAEHIKTTEAKCGSVSYFADDEFIGRALSDCGAYSPGEPELWAKLLKPGDNAVDAGANIGALTLPLARIVAPGMVVAYEPQPENFGLLRRNVEQNELGNVIRLWASALGAEEGMVHVPMLHELDSENFGRVTLGSGSQATTVTTLDRTLGVEVKLIKIDVEGNEAEVINGARETIAKCRPFLYVENDRPEKSEALLRLIRSLGYRAFEHQPTIAPAESLAHDNNGRLLRDIVSLNLLCVPQEKLATVTDVTADLKPVVPASPRLGTSGWAGVARFGGIGDNLIAASVLRPLKTMGYKIDVITEMPNAVVFENNPFIDKLSVVTQKLPTGMTWQEWFKTRASEYDLFAHLSHTCEAALAVLPAQTWYQWRPSARRKYFGHSYLEFAHDVAGVPYEFGPLFFPSDEERDLAIITKRQIGGGPIVGWALNGSRVDKVYPKTAMAIARLIQMGAQVVMFGAPPPYRDFENAKQCLEFVVHQNGSERGLHLALSPLADNPTWPIRRSLAQLLQCDLAIGPDTGQMWAVAMEPMPKIMLHSHASVQNITKHWINTTSLHPDPDEVKCWPCHMLHDTIDSCLDEQRRCGMKPDPGEKGAACIQTISVEAIVQSATKALQHGRPT